MTSVPPELAGKYAKTITELQAALQDYQPPLPVASAARGQRSNRNGVALKCQCSPPKTIRVAESNLEYVTARCEACGQPFTA